MAQKATTRVRLPDSRTSCQTQHYWLDLSRRKTSVRYRRLTALTAGFDLFCTVAAGQLHERPALHNNKVGRSKRSHGTVEYTSRLLVAECRCLNRQIFETMCPQSGLSISAYSTVTSRFMHAIFGKDRCMIFSTRLRTKGRSQRLLIYGTGDSDSPRQFESREDQIVNHNVIFGSDSIPMGC